MEASDSDKVLLDPFSGAPKCVTVALPRNDACKYVIDFHAQRHANVQSVRFESQGHLDGKRDRTRTALRSPLRFCGKPMKHVMHQLLNRKTKPTIATSYAQRRSSPPSIILVSNVTSHKLDVVASL